MDTKLGKFPVKVSARHIHLKQETLEKLFGEGFQLESADGPVKGQYLSTSRVKVVGPKNSFDRVAVMGPCRNFDQLEISATDARNIGLPAVLRESGHIEGTPGIKVVGPAGEVELSEGVIIAERHIHMGKIKADELGYKDGDRVYMCVESNGRRTIFGDTVIHTNGPAESGALSHIDTDEGNACLSGKETMGFILAKQDEINLFPEI